MCQALLCGVDHAAGRYGDARIGSRTKWRARGSCDDRGKAGDVRLRAVTLGGIADILRPVLFRRPSGPLHREAKQPGFARRRCAKTSRPALTIKDTKIAFTDLAIKRLNPPKTGQSMYWDQGCKGLALLVSPRGAKTFRALFKLDDRFISTAIGRYGDVTLQWARGEAERVRNIARDGVDPRIPHVASPQSKAPYAHVRKGRLPLHRGLLQGPSAALGSDRTHPAEPLRTLHAQTHRFDHQGGCAHPLARIPR